MTYQEARKEIEKIRSEFTSSGDFIFTCAIQNVIEYGAAMIITNDWYYEAIDDIDERHDAAEAIGKYLVMTRDFEKAIVECTYKLAHIDVTNLIRYIQREMWFYDTSVDITYKKSIDFLKRCMEYVCEHYSYKEEILNEFYVIGFTDYDIEELGYGYLFNNEEDEE